MPLFNGQAIGTPVLVAFLTVVAIAFTFVAIAFALRLRGMVIRSCYGRIHDRYLGV